MVEKAAGQTPRRRGPISEHPDLDQTIIRIVSGEGDAAFGTILRCVKDQFPVSRHTVARRLARMIRFSQIVRLRHGHYSIGSSSEPPATVLRMQTLSLAEFISPDGSARYQLGKEFLVLSGRCDRITTQIEPGVSLRARGFDVAGLDVTGSRRIRMTTYHDGGKTTMIARFIPPISATPWIPHKLLVSWPSGPHHYFMQQGPKGSESPTAHVLQRNRHIIGVLSNPAPGTIVETSEDTILDVRVHFPRGFPRGPVRPRVTTILLGESLDAEAKALVALSKKSRGALGLTVHRDLVTMRVKNPLIDCFYGFTWAPPKADAYARWVERLRTNGRGRVANFVP
jgi:hypothetical protein